MYNITLYYRKYHHYVGVHSVHGTYRGQSSMAFAEHFLAELLPQKGWKGVADIMFIHICGDWGNNDQLAECIDMLFHSTDRLAHTRCGRTFTISWLAWISWSTVWQFACVKIFSMLRKCPRIYEYWCLCLCLCSEALSLPITGFSSDEADEAHTYEQGVYVTFCSVKYLSSDVKYFVRVHEVVQRWPH